MGYLELQFDVSEIAIDYILDWGWVVVVVVQNC